jgi:exodeoxyribonuclease VII small subunit
MAKKASTQKRPAGKMSFEEATEELEAIIERIESGDSGLEQSLTERARGEELIQRCRAILDVAEQELERISLADDEDQDGD